MVSIEFGTDCILVGECYSLVYSELASNKRIIKQSQKNKFFKFLKIEKQR